MSKLRKRFTWEERLKRTKQSFQADAVVTHIADKFGIAATTLTRWRQEFRLIIKMEPSGQEIKVMIDEERQIARLKNQRREAELELDILKNAIGIFSKSDG